MSTGPKSVRLGKVTTDEYKERALRALQDAHNDLIADYNALKEKVNKITSNVTIKTIIEEAAPVVTNPVVPKPIVINQAVDLSPYLKTADLFSTGDPHWMPKVNPNFLFTVPDNSTAPAPPMLGVKYGFTTGVGDFQGITSIDGKGNLTLVAQYFGGTRINAFIQWRDHVNGGEYIRIAPEFKSGAWSSSPSNIVEIQFASLLISPRELSGAPNAPSLIVERLSSGTQDIQQWTSEAVGGVDGFVAQGGGVTPLAGITRSGGMWLSDLLQLPSGKAPATSTAPGVIGQVAWDSNYFYQCVGTNIWKRCALSTF